MNHMLWCYSSSIRAYVDLFSSLTPYRLKYRHTQYLNSNSSTLLILYDVNLEELVIWLQVIRMWVSVSRSICVTTDLISTYCTFKLRQQQILCFLSTILVWLLQLVNTLSYLCIILFIVKMITCVISQPHRPIWCIIHFILSHQHVKSS